MNPSRLIAVGFVLVLVGAVLPFLMVVRVIEPRLMLSFASYWSSVAGMFLGLIGAASMAAGRFRSGDGDDPRDAGP